MAIIGEASLRIIPEGKGFAGSTSTIVKRALIGAGVAAAAGVGFALKAFGDFDAKINESISIMGKVSDVMRNDMSDAAREVGKTTTLSATEAAEGFYPLASAGLNAAQSIKALPQVAAFAQAGLFDMSTATDLAVNSQMALGLSSGNAGKNLKQLTRVTDVLVGANNLATGTVEDFATALTTKAGAALKVTNKDIEEGVAVLALYAERGVHGAIAGEGLSIVLRDVTRAAARNKDEFKKLGIEVFNQEGNLKNLATIIDEFDEGMGKMSDGQKAAAFEALGLTRSVGDQIRILSDGGDKIRAYEDDLRGMGGTTQDVARKQMDTLNEQIANFRDIIVDIFIELGGRMAPALITGLQALAPVVEKIPAFFDAAVDEVGEIMDGLQPFFTEAGGWVADFSTAVVDQVGQIGGSLFDAFNDAITDGDWGSLGQALGQALVDAVSAAAEGAGDLTGAIVALFASIDWVDVGKSIGRTIIPMIVGIGTTIVDGLFEVITEHPLDLLALIASLIPVGRLGGIIAKTLGKIPFVGPLFRIVGNAFKKVGGFIENVVGAVWRNTFGRLFKGIGQVIDFAVPGLVTRIINWFKLLPTRLGLIGLEILESVGNWFELVGAWLATNASRYIIQPLSRLGGVVGRALAGAGRWLLGAGRAIIGGLLRGVGTAARAVGGFLNRNVVQPVLRVLSRFFGPMVARGRSIISGLVSGVRSAVGSFIGFIASLPGRAIRAIGNLVRPFVSKGREIISGLREGVTGFLGQLLSFVGSIPGRIVSALGSLGSLLYSAGRSIISGLLNGIRDGLQSVWNEVSSIAGKIRGLKGPIQKDRRLLIPQGEAIMQGLGRGIGSGFSKHVEGQLREMTRDMGSGVVGPVAAAGARGGRAPAATPAGPARFTAVVEIRAADGMPDITDFIDARVIEIVEETADYRDDRERALNR
jgi:TP901 family phage tail tape measure protein